MNKTNCIAKNDCGCMHNNKHYETGSEIVISKCKICTCSEGLLDNCKIKANCHSDGTEACSWSSWGSWGPCFGPCGVNGIQWSFRSPAVPSVYGNEG